MDLDILIALARLAAEYAAQKAERDAEIVRDFPAGGIVAEDEKED